MIFYSITIKTKDIIITHKTIENGIQENGGNLMKRSFLKTFAILSLSGLLLVGCSSNNNPTTNNGNNSSDTTTSQTTGQVDNNTNSTQNSNTTETTSKTNASVTNSSGEITEEEAKAIAYENAGVKAKDVTSVQVKKDMDDGVLIYEVEFFTATKKYEYDIKASDGKVLKLENETIKNSQTGNTNQKQLTEDEAKNIVLKKVSGATQDDIRIKLDNDDGRLQYEGKVIYDGTEYEFDIDAYTGEVLTWEEGSVFD